MISYLGLWKPHLMFRDGAWRVCNAGTSPPWHVGAANRWARLRNEKDGLLRAAGYEAS